METIIVILSIAGAIASIIGIFQNKSTNCLSKIMFIIILLISGAWGYTFYLYKSKIDEELKIERRKEIVSKEARKLLESAPAYISVYDPGISEGWMLSTLVFLEKNKELFPDSYEMYRQQISTVRDMVNRENDFSKKQEILHMEGETALRLLRSLSQ